MMPTPNPANQRLDEAAFHAASTVAAYTNRLANLSPSTQLTACSLLRVASSLSCHFPHVKPYTLTDCTNSAPILLLTTVFSYTVNHNISLLLFDPSASQFTITTHETALIQPHLYSKNSPAAKAINCPCSLNEQHLRIFRSVCCSSGLT